MRLFVGVFPPDDFRAALTAVAGQLRPLIKAAAWVQPENYHLTVAFLGEVREKDRATIEERLQQISLNFSPLNLRFRRLELWRNEWDGWVAVVTFQKSAKFEKLRQEILLGLADLRQPPASDERGITPHLTLFRIHSLGPKKKLEGGLEKFSLELRDFSFPIKMLSLVQSTLGRSGSYRFLRQLPAFAESHGFYPWMKASAGILSDPPAGGESKDLASAGLAQRSVGAGATGFARGAPPLLLGVSGN